MNCRPQWPVVWKQMFLHKCSQILLALWMMKGTLSVFMLQFGNVCQRKCAYILQIVSARRRNKLDYHTVCNEFHEQIHWQMHIAYDKCDQWYCPHWMMRKPLISTCGHFHPWLRQGGQPKVTRHPGLLGLSGRKSQIFLSLKKFYWSIIGSQCCVSFRCSAT